MNFQMIEAPTNEMARGRKISVLANFSVRAPSTAIAYSRPIATEVIGTIATQKKVFRMTIRMSGWVNIHL